MNAYLGGGEVTGKTVLRDVINATIGFEQLAADLQKPSKSLRRMLGPRGNPNTANFFAILHVFQKYAMRPADCIFGFSASHPWWP